MLTIPAEEWSERKVLSLPVGEFTWLEYKGSQKADPNRFAQEISPLVSAMINSGGGHIVLGVSDPQPGEALKIDGGIPCNLKNGFKGWLEDVIPTITDPALTKFEVFEIGSDGTSISQIESGKAVYVIELPPSSRPPHQALDNRYYVRSGSKNRPVGHQEVIGLLMWREALRLELTNVGIQPYLHVNAILAVKITNIGNRRINAFQCDLRLPTIIKGLGSINCKDAELLILDGVAWLRFPVRRTTPLFPQQSVSTRFHLKNRGNWEDPKIQNDGDHAEFTLWADDNLPEKGVLPVSQLMRPRLDYQETENL